MRIKNILGSLTVTFFITIMIFATTASPANAKYPTAGSSAGSLGKVTVGTDVSEWNVGSGQFNGEFTVTERQGIELGLRIQKRYVGPAEVTPDNGNRTGIYDVKTGDTGDNNATWNYDWHVDLSNARGNAKGKTLSDYRLVLEQDFTDESLFGTLGAHPVELPLIPGVCAPGTFDPDSLCQQSWNPGFGNDDFNPDAEGTYHLRLVLIPYTFNGPPVSVSIEVNVTD